MSGVRRRRLMQGWQYVVGSEGDYGIMAGVYTIGWKSVKQIMSMFASYHLLPISLGLLYRLGVHPQITCT